MGLSLALELHHRGLRVTVVEQSAPLLEASTAAAGMLAATDHANPPQLRPLADFSLTLYPSYLERLQSLSRIPVSFHTSTTLQALPAHEADSTGVLSPGILSPDDLHRILPQLIPGKHRFQLIEEHSLDPRQLATSLIAAVRSTSIDLHTQTHVLSACSIGESVEVHTSAGILHAAQFVDCTGSWAAASSPLPHLNVAPRKGQMLAVSLPPSLVLRSVVRTSSVYIVPRAAGPDTTRTIIGATIEDAGFDKTVHAHDIAHLRDIAASLLPEIAYAPQLEAWAGLRPATPDGLPLLGPIPGQPNRFLATGHYRNGILLAPATAYVMAQLLTGERTSVDLTAYSPARPLPPG